MNSKTKTALPPAIIALAAAFLFGASTPAAKLLIAQTNPQLLAGLMYLGSGIGLFGLKSLSGLFKPSTRETNLRSADLPWLAGAVIIGGILAPVLLMLGLRSTGGGPASLLLNTEAVFTALLAWFAFKENFDRRIAIGMISIAVGSFLLSWQPGAAASLSVGSVAIIGACFCWGLDNNFTRNIADADPMQIAAIKGLIAGAVNCGIAFACGARCPSIDLIVGAALVGFFGYGLSLVLYIRALRFLGTARCGAYFSTAPFVGTVLSLFFLHDKFSPVLLAASGFMALGVWLHLTEHHEHEHEHVEEEHEHLHCHDEHHQHDHEPGISLNEPHSHWHKHMAITHSHPHYPDSKHRHEH